MLAHRKTWVAGLDTRVFWQRWPTLIIQGTTPWLNGMAGLLKPTIKCQVLSGTEPPPLALLDVVA